MLCEKARMVLETNFRVISDAAPLKPPISLCYVVAQTYFRVISDAAPLKHVEQHFSGTLIRKFPRHLRRGPIEAEDCK